MKKALFVAKQLLGDGLNVAPALQAWHWAHPNHAIDLWTLADGTTDIYGKMGVPVRVVTDEHALRYPYDFQFTFDCGEAFTIAHQAQCHITVAYAAALGVKITSSELTYQPVEEPHASGLVLISPFSRSCASNEGKPANKMLSTPIWNRVIKELRLLDASIGVLGAQSDKDRSVLDADEWYCGLPLNQVALMLRDAKLVVTIDNGIAHLAASQSARMVLFYPACLGKHWIVPVNTNSEYAVFQVDPATVAPVQVISVMRKVVHAIRTAYTHV